MGSDSIPLWIIFIICVIGGAYFAATESSFSAVNKIKMKTLADDGNKRAKGVLSVLSKFDKALSTLLIGNNVTKIVGASVFTILATNIFREAFNQTEDFLNSFAFSVICSVLSTIIIFMFSEMIPKSFANDRSESVSMFFQGSLRFLMKILAPFAVFFNAISKFVSRLFLKKEADPSITEDELTEIIDTAEEEGVFDEEQGDMLKSALEFTKTTVDEIMTMDKDIDYVNLSDSTLQILETIKNTNYSRLPVKSQNGKVVGILRIRTFLREYHRNRKVNLRSVMTTPYFIHEDFMIDDLLTEMRQKKIQMAMVQDKNKAIVGLVTIEDVLEELVGEIWDEEDIVDQNFQALGGNKYMVNTRMLMSSVYEKMGVANAPKLIASKPLLSFILETLGHLPVEDESFVYENLEITTKTIENGTVTEVIVHLLDEEDILALQNTQKDAEV